MGKMILEKFSLEGRNAIVTGSNRRIGQSCALALAEAGADIIGVTYQSSSEELEKRINRIGRKCKSYICDLSRREDLYKLIDNVTKDFEHIDILVNNAGAILRSPVAEHPDEYWDKVIEINLSSQFIITIEIEKRMVIRGFGKIVFIASLLSFQGGILVPGYAASKGV